MWADKHRRYAERMRNRPPAPKPWKQRAPARLTEYEKLLTRNALATPSRAAVEETARKNAEIQDAARWERHLMREALTTHTVSPTDPLRRREEGAESSQSNRPGAAHTEHTAGRAQDGPKQMGLDFSTPFPTRKNPGPNRDRTSPTLNWIEFAIACASQLEPENPYLAQCVESYRARSQNVRKGSMNTEKAEDRIAAPESEAPAARVSGMLCLACGAPREPDLTRATPGVTPYLPCARCGVIGIRPENDRLPDNPTRPKKAARDLYERSRYRGGKLIAPKTEEERTA